MADAELRRNSASPQLPRIGLFHASTSVVGRIEEDQTAAYEMLKRSLAKNVSPAASAPPPPGQDRQRRSICDGLPRLVDAVRLATPWPDLSAGRRHPRRVAMGALKRTHGTMRWQQGPHRYHGPLPSSRSTIPPRTFPPVRSMAHIMGSRLLKWLPSSPVNFW